MRTPGTPSRWKYKLVLTGLVVAALATTTTAATMAAFNAQTTNPTNKFATGSLVLSDTKQGGSACLSTGGGNTNTNSNGSCDQLFNLTALKPGDTASANLTLQNVGTMAASAFKLFGSACADSDATGETYHGTGSVCGVMQLTVQQYSDAAFTTPSACVYGAATGSTCNFTDTAKTLGDFATSYTGAGSALTIGSGLAAGASAYFKLSVQLPSTADNSYQGRQAATSFSWYLNQ
jgi:hypothetical protein